MTYPVDSIVQVTTKLVPGALSYANFGFACLFVTEVEAPDAADTFKDYTTTAQMLTDGWVATDEGYLAAEKWLGSAPSTRQLRVYVKATGDVSYVDTYAKAADSFWWYITLNTIDLYDDTTDTLLSAAWCDSNERFFPSPTNEAAALVPGDATTVPYDLTALGYRRAISTYHATDRYAAFPILSWFATINWNVPNSVPTGEYKVISNVTASDLTTTQQNALLEDDTKCGFVSDIDLQGSTVNSRYINSITHSANGEWIDDVFGLDAFINQLKADLFNVIANQPTKLGQTIAGQQAILTTAKNSCERFIENGYLGERNYVNPDTGLEEYTRGYSIISKAEDILDLTEGERDDRLSAPVVIRVFRAGAIHKAIVDLTVY